MPAGVWVDNSFPQPMALGNSSLPKLPPAYILHGSLHNQSIYLYCQTCVKQPVKGMAKTGWLKQVGA